MLPLRYYQKDAFESAMAWVRRSIEPCLIEAATGAGKSFIVAAIADELHKASGKHILCLQPNSDLVKQNKEKYLMTGNPASVYSASAGGKCLRHPVVFATPGTVKNRITLFGNRFCAVVIDEAHGITPTVRGIVDHMREQNPLLRVIGLTATPYRMNDGYIYGMDENGKPTGEYSCRDPYFAKKVYTIKAHTLIEEGYLTRPVIGAINSAAYDTSGLELNSQGKFDQSTVDKAYHGHGRLTSQIVADVVRQSAGRKGVMLFAATVQHAQEVMASLPPGLSRMIGGKINTGKTDRKNLVADFKKQRFKYLVSVDTMTTGVDFTHVDVIALLRRTESVGLLQQIIGRGLRTHQGKEDVTIFDYAENLDTHCPDGDVFSPKIKAGPAKGSAEPLECDCELCGVKNTFGPRPNDEGYGVDNYGYFVDLAGHRIMSDHGPMPAHFGRRCQGQELRAGGVLQQCQYRWTFKACPYCESENDIAARYCCECRSELVNPNDKLKADFKALKRDPSRIQCDEIIEMTANTVVARTSGKECIKVDFKTSHRNFTVWYRPDGKGIAGRKYRTYAAAIEQGAPVTVTYRKDPESGMYETLAFNQEADACEISRVA